MNYESESAIWRGYELKDWTFVFGLPTTKRQFENAKAYGEFCVIPPGYRSFAEYEESVLSGLDRCIAPFEALGLRIVRYPTSAKYMKMLSGASPSILYTHCSRNAQLEFSDGLTSFSHLARRLSPTFHGVAEICACAPHDLNSIFKAAAPYATIATPYHELSAKLWTAYYGEFFLNFVDGSCSYGDATIQTRAKVPGFATPAQNQSSATG